MANMYEIGVRINGIFDPSAQDSLDVLVRGALQRAQAMAGEYEAVVDGSGNTNEHVALVRERLHRIMHGLGEIVGETAGLGEEVRQLLVGWGVDAATGETAAVSAPRPARPVPQPAVTNGSTVPSTQNTAETRTRNGARILRIIDERLPQLSPKRLALYTKITAYVSDAARQRPAPWLAERATAVAHDQTQEPANAAMVVAGNLAALSLRSATSEEDSRLFDETRQDTKVRERAVMYVKSFLTSFTLNQGQPVRSELLQTAGISPASLPPELQGALPDPPLDLLVLAADIVTVTSDNSPEGSRLHDHDRSIISYNSPGSMKKCTREEYEFKRALSLTHRPDLVELEKMSRYLEYDSRLRMINGVRTSLQAYLTRHFRQPIVNKAELEFAAECRIAERIDMANAPPDLQRSVRARLAKAWSHLPPESAAKWSAHYQRVGGGGH